MKKLTPFLAAATLITSVACLGGSEVDPSALYTLSTEGSTQKVAAGQKAKLVIHIDTKPEAYVSNEAPLRIELSGTNATPDKQKLTIADTTIPMKDGKHKTPHFEVTYATVAPGAATLDAKVTLFICTADLCVRQVKNVSVPVQVSAASKAL